ncbi:PKD domain containing protein [Candidatus Sulfotelmatomonas gaucii]|uniref:PKD domain containing protein n=1 Tax=Candidatus Sulfuritelmatomonas gaucii TaxID=2043161 RepID=A0A2N9L243_9BACT|nr:PKD domain containing protein [Candidatus Sulfotelmatomonas gaucii]
MKPKLWRVSPYVERLFAIAVLALIPIGVAAQAATAGHGPSNESASRFDIFAGYSYLSPHGTVQVRFANGTIAPYSYDAVNAGAILSGAYFFNRFVGIEVESAEHEFGGARPNTNIGTQGNDDGFVTVAGGVIVRFPRGTITPFILGLGGGAMAGGPYHEPNTWGPDLTAGGGMDIETPWFNHHLAIRLFQADYEYMHADFGNRIFGGTASINAARLSAGLVIHTGSVTPPTPVTLACSANPETVYPGDPVTVTASAGGLNPKENVIYSWSGTGVTGNDTTAKVDTGSLAPGEYSVQGTVKEGRKGKEGLRPWETANCTAGITVKAYEPPTISCSVSPTTIKPGESATITLAALSPQNRPLTYSYAASAGTISGIGTTAEYSSAGAATGVVGITCNVSDDKGHSANSSTNVTIAAPPPPPQPHAQALCSITFANDPRRPTRVDNEAKACLDQVALDLKQQADAKAVLVGESTETEKATTAKQEQYATRHKRAMVEYFAAQRAVNAKNYLVTDQGVDASRITVVTNPMSGQTVQNYLVPAGADFGSDVTGTTPVDETTVKPEERKPLPARRR